MFRLMLLAGAGGFVGTCCRFLMNKFFLAFWKNSFPAATFTINVLGCLIFGILFGIFTKNGVLSPKLNALFIVGFCGGFTTFSTFSFESFSLATNGEILSSLFYILISLIAGILFLWIGLMLTR